MNILFLDQFSGLGGGQQCLRDLIPGITARGWKAHAALPPGGGIASEIAAMGVPVHALPLEPYGNGSKSTSEVLRFAAELPRLAGAIRRIIQRHNIDLLYVNGPRVLPAAAAACGRVVFHSHSLLGLRYTSALAGLALKGRGATVIASSRFVAAPLQAWVRRERLRVIYNGVPDCGFRGERPTGPAAPNRIGIIGRVAPEKGQRDFVLAARLIHNRVPDCRFVICGDPQHGDGAYLREVRELAGDLPVEFTGWQKDIARVLRGLDLVVLPSAPVDATPRVVMEAFSAGVPVIAYPSGGLTELIEHEINGLITEEGNPESLAKTICSLLGNPSRMERLGNEARRHYELRFTVARFRAEVISVLERL